ncbi:oligosaccharide 4-alpha-D-glucosyltransferase [Ancylomarina subtilis]|uniref:Oligosaccharide 4-alpha-D-glucosyltransferase n=1 Tax=Ancylomarina subtilis TaxID=1639035 RepID=A0A4Q7V5M1_9BACT|nr:TIM-barrel domain-containing protein [Ancylomarina subtilis]RZT91836.1 oligosaccharide 4-alpha-D-glucosyltransferase [Ancylomarina subtilis]
MRKNFFLKIQVLCLLVFLSGIAIAQNKQRTYKSYELKNEHLVVNTNDGQYLIKFYNKNIVETSFIPAGERFNAESHAVVLKPEEVKAKLTDSKSELTYASSGMKVLLNKSPFQISYSYKGNQLISEKRGYFASNEYENIEFNLDSTESLMGGGARVLGMNRRGYKLQLYNRAHYGYGTHSELMNYTMPLVISSKCYAVHFDNAPIGFLDLDSEKNNTLAYETLSGRKTYQVIAGGTWPEFMQEFTDLTGKQALIPRWALGNFSSRFGYHSEKETRETVEAFKKDSIPLDAIILDLFWFGKEMKGNMGNLEFLRDSFPDPKQMMADFNKQGVKTILITEPFILTTSKRWDEAVENKVLGTDSLGNPFKYDFYFGNTGLVDVFKPEAIDWFWNIYKEQINNGVGGWWGDLGEPEVHPSALQHVNGSADEVHNIYGHQWAKLVFEGYKKDFPNQRPFILMRAGAVGSQRYGMIPWSGDVSRSWDGLKPQTEISLQMGLQGMAYMHSDLGGFAGDNLDDELYVRWLQYGVFQPIFRPHAQEAVPSEPVFREAKTKALAKKAIELRYRMLPYNYSLAHENSVSGMPLMRPLFFEENNRKLFDVSETYMWGDAFLVSPITDAKAIEREVYFPANNSWFDFYTDQMIEGGSSKKVDVVEDHIPVYVRAGSFVPMAKLVQSTVDYSSKHIDLHYYHAGTVAEGHGYLFDDDGQTPDAFEKGNYEKINFTSRADKKNLTIRFDSEKGTNFSAVDREFELIIHNIIREPRKVKLAGKKADFSWNAQKNLLSVRVKIKSGDANTVNVKF